MPKAVYFILFILTLVFSSCFEVIEEVDLNEDGSGKFKMTLNMSQSKKEIDAAMLLDSIGTISIPSKAYIEGQAERGALIMASVRGITNVKVNKDFENYIFEISCNFGQLSDLNTAIEKVYTNLSTFGYSFAGTFSYSDGIFKRSMDRQTQAILSGLNRRNAKMTKNATYTAIYRFNKEVSKTSNSDARVSGSGKATMLKYSAEDLARGHKSLHNEITFK